MYFVEWWILQTYALKNRLIRQWDADNEMAQFNKLSFT